MNTPAENPAQSRERERIKALIEGSLKPKGTLMGIITSRPIDEEDFDEIPEQEWIDVAYSMKDPAVYGMYLWRKSLKENGLNASLHDVAHEMMEKFIMEPSIYGMGFPYPSNFPKDFEDFYQAARKAYMYCRGSVRSRNQK